MIWGFAMISLLRGFLGYLLVAIKAGLAADPIERERVEFESLSGSGLKSNGCSDLARPLTTPSRYAGEE
jgi:hypothetical protein